jgi:hypothetical protein
MSKDGRQLRTTDSCQNSVEGIPAGDCRGIRVMTATIYSCADVAELLRVTRAAVTNYRMRYDDTPTPTYETTNGYVYWNADGMREWLRWHKRFDKSPQTDLDARAAAIASLRAQLENEGAS